MTSMYVPETFSDNWAPVGAEAGATPEEEITALSHVDEIAAAARLMAGGDAGNVLASIDKMNHIWNEAHAGAGGALLDAIEEQFLLPLSNCNGKAMIVKNLQGLPDPKPWVARLLAQLTSTR
jgi:hypothetical protein